MNATRPQSIPPPPEQQPKKMVRRSVAIVLGIVCIILVAGLLAIIVYYVSIANLAESVVIVKSATVSQGASAYSTWTFGISYAGYVSVELLNFAPTITDAASVEVVYSSHGASYDNLVWIHVGETAVFPVLPTSNLQVRVGNGYWLNGATETVTITYYY